MINVMVSVRNAFFQKGSPFFLMGTGLLNIALAEP